MTTQEPDLFSFIDTTNPDNAPLVYQAVYGNNQPKRELNSMYWNHRLHLIHCVRTTTIECPHNYSDTCEMYKTIMKEYNEDLYYKYKRMVMTDDNLKQFRKYFKL
jgi:hypothetical protein